MKRIFLYSHVGSANHGCEALVRTTTQLIQPLSPKRIGIVSWQPEEDKKYLRDLNIEIIQRGRELSHVERIWAKGIRLLTGSMVGYDRVEHSTVFHTKQAGLWLSVGGDNYCYPGWQVLSRSNAHLHKCGCKTILWGCSITPDMLKDNTLLEDLQRYDLITVRESLTMRAMQEAGLENILYCPDTAFLLEPQPVELPDIFDSEVIGINLSPMALQYASVPKAVLKGHLHLISYLLKNTAYNIALIPHVVSPFHDDLEALKILKDSFAENPRVVILDVEKAWNCRQTKYAISKCAFMIAARTHASIAAYSTGVPTLVVGYSSKARGIAKDIFKEEKGYVLPVQEFEDETILLSTFLKLQEQQAVIKQSLIKFRETLAPYYKATIEHVHSIVDNLSE